MNRRELLGKSIGGGAALLGRTATAAAESRRYLYVAEPGIRNYVEFGGVGVLVFDIDAGYRFVRRIPTWPEVPGVAPENVKGICASAGTGRLFVSTVKRLGCIDLLTDKMLWSREYPGGCDRMSIAPNGSHLYVPSLEGPHWHAVNAADGAIIQTIVTNSGAHNTVYGLNGKAVYLAGLKSPYLFVADPSTHRADSKVGPFSEAIRPFTVNGRQTRCYVNVNKLLGFEIGDLESGRMLSRVEIPGFQTGPVKRHGCPSHGIGLTPDENEIWVVDAFNQRVHFFENKRDKPRWMSSVALREQPGWITFTLDGKHGLLSTGEVFDVRSHTIIHALTDETGRQAHSEKVLEIDFRDGKPTRNGDQFGLGRRR